MKVPHSDYLINKFTDADGDQLLMYSIDDEEEHSVVISVACPHRGDGLAMASVRVPVEILEEYLDNLEDERDGEDVEDYEIVAVEEDDEDED